MSLGEFLKYLLWMALFALALIGLYTLIGNLGVI